MNGRDWLLYIATFASAFAVSMLTTPLAKKISVKVGAIDPPKDRGVHDKPMPRLGGAAIIFGFFTSLILVYPFIKDSLETKQFLGFLAGALVIIIAGFLDDTRQLKALTKLLFQSIAALIVIACDIRVKNVFMWPFTLILQELSIPMTFVWIIAVTNAVNLIDGLDGLAVGVSSIASFFLMLLCLYTGSPIAVVLSSALAGSCLGFLPRNFNPAEIFMGDMGAMFLGYVLAVSSILGVFKGYALIAVSISLLSIGLPLFETLFSIFRRAINKQPIMKADKSHFHHKLLEKGFTQKEAVLFLYFVSMSSGVIAILITIENLKLVIIAFILFVSLSFFFYKYNVNKKKNKNI